MSWIIFPLLTQHGASNIEEVITHGPQGEGIGLPTCWYGFNRDAPYLRENLQKLHPVLSQQGDDQVTGRGTMYLGKFPSRCHVTFFDGFDDPTMLRH
jgi:hypothetical protein